MSITLVLAFPWVGFAQDQNPATGDRTGAQQAQGSLLPEIDPQDIEIRSEFKARFPGVRRQPILGFNPRPRVYRVDPNRMPFTESQEDVLANLPIGSLDRPEAPVYIPYARPELRKGRITSTLGSLLSPNVNAVLNLPFSVDSVGRASTWLTTSLNGAHLSDYERNQSAQQTLGDLNTRLSHSNREGGFVIADLSGRYRRENLFLLPATDLAGGAPGGATSTQDPFRSWMGGDAEVSIGRSANAFRVWKLTLGGGMERFDMNSRSLAEVALVDERRVVADLTFLWPSQRPLDIWRAGGSLSYTDLIAKEGIGHDPKTLLIRTNGQWERSTARSRMSASIGVAALAEGDSGVEAYEMPPTVDGDRIRVLPEGFGEFQHSPAEWLHLSAGIEGAVVPMNVKDLLQKNPFLNPGTPLSNAYSAGGRLDSEMVLFRSTTLRLGARAEWSWKAPVFHRVLFDDADPLSLSYFRVSPEDFRILSLSASLTQPLILDRFWIEAEGFVSSTTLFQGGGPAPSDPANGGGGGAGGVGGAGAGGQAGTNRIPYVENVRIVASTYARLFDPVELGLSTRYLGTRETFSGDRLDPFLIFSGDLRFRISDRLTLHAQATNLLNRKYQIWDGFTERPFEVFGGISLDL